MNENELVVRDVVDWIERPRFEPRSKKFREAGPFTKGKRICNIKYGTQLGSGVSSSTYVLCITDDCLPRLVVKVSLPHMGILNDYFCRVMVNDTLEIDMPHNIARVYGKTTCRGRRLKWVEDVGSSLIDRTDQEYIIVVLERCTTTFARLIEDRWKTIDFRLVKDGIPEKYVMFSIIFQVLMSLAVLRKYMPSFSHNDLHLNNVLLKSHSKPLQYTHLGKTYEIKRPRYVAVLNDFDMARIPGKIEDERVWIKKNDNSSDVFFFLSNLNTEPFGNTIDDWGSQTPIFDLPGIAVHQEVWKDKRGSLYAKVPNWERNFDIHLRKINTRGRLDKTHPNVVVGVEGMTKVLHMGRFLLHESNTKDSNAYDYIDLDPVKIMDAVYVQLKRMEEGFAPQLPISARDPAAKRRTEPVSRLPKILPKLVNLPRRRDASKIPRIRPRAGP